MTQWTFLCQLGNLDINQLTTYIYIKKKILLFAKLTKFLCACLFGNLGLLEMKTLLQYTWIHH